jgi:hypothetical protein
MNDNMIQSLCQGIDEKLCITNNRHRICDNVTGNPNYKSWISSIKISNNYNLKSISKLVIYGYDGSSIWEIPFYLLLKLSIITEIDNYTIIRIPHNIFYKELNFVGIHASNDYFNLELKSKEDIPFTLLFKTWSYNNEMNEINDKTIEYKINEFLTYELNDTDTFNTMHMGTKDIMGTIDILDDNKDEGYMGDNELLIPLAPSVPIILRNPSNVCSGFFIESDKEINNIKFIINGYDLFDYDKYLIRRCGKLLNVDIYNKKHVSAIYESLNDSLPQEVIHYHIEQNVKSNYDNKYLYWIPIDPYYDWSNNELTSHLNLSRIDIIKIELDVAINGNIHFMTHNILRFGDGKYAKH